MKVNNSVSLVGNVGSDISVQLSQSGVKVGSFSIAVSEKYKTQTGEQKERVDWFKVVCFGEYNNALSKLVLKGNQVIVHGSLRTRSYQDKEGVTHYVVEVLLEQLFLLNK